MLGWISINVIRTSSLGATPFLIHAARTLVFKSFFLYGILLPHSCESSFFICFVLLFLIAFMQLNSQDRTDNLSGERSSSKSERSCEDRRCFLLQHCQAEASPLKTCSIALYNPERRSQTHHADPHGNRCVLRVIVALSPGFCTTTGLLTWNGSELLFFTLVPGT